ncbi:MAG: DNA cytosine methyltransferase [Sulfuricella sp.]|nr:DNA cytosine methyltransferase [Sulfuricella sp.]
MGRINKVIAIDFFCGAGGMTNGLIQAGIHVLAGVDNKALCEKTYRQNVNPDGSRPDFICKDIFPKTDEHPGGEQHEISKLLSQLIEKQTEQSGGIRPKLIFALCAPCQPFTKISHVEMSTSCKFKRSNDSNLLLTTVHLIKKFRPDALICENVEGITGEGSVLSQFEAQLNEMGYVFDAKVINAAKFGVPQHRRRTIGLAVRKGRRKKIEISVPDADPDLKKYVTVAESIGHLPPLAAGEVHPTIKNHRSRALSDLNLKRIASAPPGENNAYLKNTRYGDLSLNCHNRLEAKAGKASFTDTYTRMRGDDIGPTITTRCISVSNGRFAHYDTDQNRGITPKEAALLQTFPNEYVFYPEDGSEFAAVLIGNAVPPRLAKFFGRYLKEQMG